jgi:3-oxoacyl-[acyl-carrier protein] reductase
MRDQWSGTGTPLARGDPLSAQTRAMTTSPGVAPPTRVAIVCGGSRGVGRAAVLRLASSGCSVAVNYAHDQAAAEATVEEVLAAEGAAVAVRADIADELDVERLFEETIDVFGGVDVLVLAVVGHVPRGPLSAASLTDADALWEATARATFIVTREAARRLRDGGSIVSVTSSLFARPTACFGVYAAARAVTDVLTRVMALELADHDITVNAVALDVEAPCEPEPIAETVEFLLSPEGHRVTGQVIQVDSPGRQSSTFRSNGGGPCH